MAKPTAPLLSFGASGSIAQALVYSKWKGRPYVRRHVIPGNPQSTAQTLTRDIFANLNAIWKLAGALLVAPWDRFADGQVLTGRNAFVGQNIGVLRGDLDLAQFIFSPGAKGGLPQASQTFTPAAGQVTVAVTAPTPPTGWTVQAAVAAALADGAPESLTLYSTVEGEDLTSPYSIVLTLAADVYAVGAWLRWLKPDGTIAYGPSVTSLVTVP